MNTRASHNWCLVINIDDIFRFENRNKQHFFCFVRRITFTFTCRPFIEYENLDSKYLHQKTTCDNLKHSTWYSDEDKDILCIKKEH